MRQIHAGRIRSALVDHFQLIGNLHLPAARFHRAHNPLVTDNRRVTNLDRNPFSDLIASLQITGIVMCRRNIHRNADIRPDRLRCRTGTTAAQLLLHRKHIINIIGTAAVVVPQRFQQLPAPDPIVQRLRADQIVLHMKIRTHITTGIAETHILLRILRVLCSDIHKQFFHIVLRVLNGATAADHACHTIAEAHAFVVSRARPVPAEIADQQRPVRQDLLDHKTNLIHMCRKHNAFLIRAVHSFFQNDQIAHRVLTDLVGVRLCLPADDFTHLPLKPSNTERLCQFFQQRFVSHMLSLSSFSP